MEPFRHAVTGLVLGLMVIGNNAMADVVLAEGGVSGEWFNAGRSGEGIFVEIVETPAGNAIAAAWFTFDEAGNQMWLVGFQALDSSQTSVTINVSRYDGPVFGPGFDSGDLNAMPWGTLTLRFPDCDSAVLNYSSTDGFGDGQIDMIRLTDLAQVSCTDPAPPPQPGEGVTPGEWGNGVTVCLNVAADGRSLTSQNSPCPEGASVWMDRTGLGVDVEEQIQLDLCVVLTWCVGDVAINGEDGSFQCKTDRGFIEGWFRSDNAADGFGYTNNGGVACGADWEAEPR